MSILVNEKTRVIVQGITGRDGAFHASQMIAYGTKVVGGVTPGKGGQKTDGGVPIFNTMAEAVSETRADASVIYVPAAFATAADLTWRMGLKVVLGPRTNSTVRERGARGPRRLPRRGAARAGHAGHADSKSDCVKNRDQ